MAIQLMPHIVIEGDSESRIIARSGELLGVTKSRALWRFGFMSDSDMAKAFGVFTDDFTWIVANHHGKVIAEYRGFAVDLPKRFREILTGSL